jgi:hypothetical protein
VRIGDNVLMANERRVESIEKISSWESRVFHSSLVVSVRCSHVYILWRGVG